jgi:hypothetical protein
MQHGHLERESELFLRVVDDRRGKVVVTRPER